VERKLQIAPHITSEVFMDLEKPKTPVPQDEYARGSFTFRRMKRSQIIGLIIALIAMIVGFILLEVNR
jgi:hypothetical protein